MGTPRTYTPDQRAQAVAEFRRLVAQGLSQRRARLEVGQRFEVNPSSLRTWAERGVVWTPGGQGDSTADVERLSQEVADLRFQLERAERRLEIAADAASYFDLAGHLSDLVLVKRFVERRVERFSPAEVVAVLREVLSFRLGAAGLVDDVDTEPTAEDLADAYAANQIWDQWVENYRCYGPNRLHRWLKSCGSELGRREVSRLMKLCGASALVYQSSMVTAVAVRWLSRFERRPSKWPVPTSLNKWWGIDLCLVKVDGDDCLVVFVVDIASRRIIDFSVRSFGPIDLSAVLGASAKVRVKECPGLVGPNGPIMPGLVAVTGDLSSQDLAQLAGLDARAAESVAMQTVGRMFQIEVAERSELTWTTQAELGEAVGSWVTWYNTVRLQKALLYRTPVEAERSLGGVS